MSFSVHVFHSRTEFRFTGFLGINPSIARIPNRWYKFGEPRKHFHWQVEHLGSRGPQRVREGFIGFGISSKRDSFWMPACPELKMLGPQRAVRAKTSASVRLPDGSGGSDCPCCGSSAKEAKPGGWAHYCLINVPCVIQVRGRESSRSREHYVLLPSQIRTSTFQNVWHFSRRQSQVHNPFSANTTSPKFWKTEGFL